MAGQGKAVKISHNSCRNLGSISNGIIFTRLAFVQVEWHLTGCLGKNSFQGKALMHLRRPCGWLSASSCNNSPSHLCPYFQLGCPRTLLLPLRSEANRESTSCADLRQFWKIENYSASLTGLGPEAHQDLQDITRLGSSAQISSKHAFSECLLGSRPGEWVRAKNYCACS